MSRRHELNRYKAFTNADTTTDPASAETDISGLDKILYQVQIDPTVVATLSVMNSGGNKYDSNNAFPLPLDFQSNTDIVLDGSIETDYLIRLDNYGLKWLRLELTNNAGTGNINAWITANSVGA